MLRIERQPRLVERRGDAAVHALEPADRREQAEPAAARRQEQFAIGSRDLRQVVLADVGDDEDAGQLAVWKWRWRGRTDRRRRPRRGAAAPLRAAPHAPAAAPA